MWNHTSVKKLVEESGNTDPVDEIRKRARTLVLDAFNRGWSGPPFNPIELARLQGLNIVPNDDVLDARIIPIGVNQYQIEYNPFQKPSRIGFSVAHEIAHTLFKDCSVQIRHREEEPSANRELERLCNIGAAEIQLPYAVFSNDANETSLTPEGLFELANKYNASLESVFLRFAEVVNRPCAILIGLLRGEKILEVDYSVSSKCFPYSIPDNFKIPTGSKSLDCKLPGWTAREQVTWAIFGKEKHNLYAVGISPYKRDNTPRVALIVVPEYISEDSFEGNKIYIEYGDACKPRGEGIKIIGQVVNTSAALGRGFGRSLANNYPSVKTELKAWASDKKSFRLGESHLVKIDDEIFVFQMLAQAGLFAKDGIAPLSYSSLASCLRELATHALKVGASIHMPLIGAGQAKGDWNIIQGMIHEELISRGLAVSVYMLPGKAFNPKNNSSLILFDESSTWVTEKLF